MDGSWGEEREGRVLVALTERSGDVWVMIYESMTAGERGWWLVDLVLIWFGLVWLGTGH